MHFIRKSQKNDPIRLATYNPKEFRGGRLPGHPQDEQSWSGSRWRVVLLLSVLGLSGWYYWGKFSGSSLISYVSAVMRPYVGRQQDLVASLPSTGTVQGFRVEPPGTIYAQLKLVGNLGGMHCLFRLNEWATGAPVLSVFVRHSETTNIMVPVGQYRGKLACGSIWYGAKLFGPGTLVDELTSPLVFTRDSAGIVAGMVIEFARRNDGVHQGR